MIRVPQFRVPFRVRRGGLQTFENVVLALNPSLYWRMGTVDGLVDRSGNGRAGSAVGAPAIGGVPGPVAPRDDDGATAFNGSSQLITSAYSPFGGGSVRTFMAWAYRVDTSSNHVIFAGSGGLRPFLWLASGNQNVVWQAQQGAGGAATWESAWPANGEWVHVALVFDDAADLATLYLNGALVSSKAHTNTYSSPGNFQVASFTGSFLKGSLDEVAVFERALTADEIRAVYDFGVKQEPTILVPATVEEVEQDSIEEIEQCIFAIAATPAGSRVEVSEFGFPDEAFTQLPPNPTADNYLEAIERWEPRARVVGEVRIEELTTKRVTIKSEAPRV